MAILKVWERNWGELYTRGKPNSYGDKIRELEMDMKKLPVQNLMTNNTLSYTWNVPYIEPRKVPKSGY